MAEEVKAESNAVDGEDLNQEAAEQLLTDLQAALESGPPSASAGTKRAREPVKLGYKTFTEGKQCTDYLRSLMANYAKGVDFNEYEYLVLLDLLKQGHPEGQKKIGCGLRGFQVRTYPGADQDSRAFFAVRKDGTAEDFSYLKCCAALFPGEVYSKPSSHGSPVGGRGGRGRGGGGRGRGGGGGRGRGGGSMWSGRGGRGRGRS